MSAFRKSYLTVWVTALVVLLASQAVLADGKMVIKPYVDLTLQRDSNYWKVDNDEKSVVTFTFAPGFEFGYTTDKSDVLMDYTLGANWFYSQDSTPAGGVRANNLDFVSHNLKALASTQATDRLNLGVEELFLYTRDPAYSAEYNNITSREKYFINRLTPQAFYDFDGKFGAGVKYVNEVIDYNSKTEEDSTKNGGAFDLKYNLNMESSVDLEYLIWTRDFDGPDSDYTSNKIMASFSQQFNIFNLKVGAGYHDRSFDKSGIDDIDLFVWKVELTGQNPPRGLGEVKSHMKVALSQDMNDLGYGQTYYKATRLDVEVGSMVMEKLDATLAGYFQNSDYEKDASDREDDSWLISGRLNYVINDRFAAGLEAGFETRDSNLAGLDYDNTYVLVNFRA
ncbi:MAG: outer membrane beta-barrel protein, partial [Pseudomonadota bacterium]